MTGDFLKTYWLCGLRVLHMPAVMRIGFLLAHMYGETETWMNPCHIGNDTIQYTLHDIGVS